MGSGFPAKVLCARLWLMLADEGSSQDLGRLRILRAGDWQPLITMLLEPGLP